MRWMILIPGLLLSGCFAHYESRYQGPPPLQTTSMDQVNAMVGAQQPAAYKVGFMEGCDSGNVSSGNTSYIFKKDVKRFDTDDVYQQGWNDGFNRCISGGGAAISNTYYQSSYGYYYPGTFYSGFYYPGYNYAPGYSIWLGHYGYPRHTHVHRRNYYYTPWYGGHKHKRGYRGHKGYAGGRYNIANPPPSRGRKHGGGGHKHKNWSGKGGGIGGSKGGSRGGGRKGGGNKSGGPYWIR